MAEVRLTGRALADLRSHDLWLRQRNAKSADRLVNDVQATMRLLAEHPLSGRTITGLRLRVSLTHRSRYRLVHRVTAEVVTVVRVLHPRQSGPS